MIIIFLPAVDSIRPQWREATESLGGNTFQYWTRVAGDVYKRQPSELTASK